MKKIINTGKAPAAVGPYSQATELNNTLFVSGQVPLNPQTGKIETMDITLQTQQVMENIKNIVETAGYSMTDIVKCTCFLSDINNFKAMNEVYARYFKSDPPARAAFQVAALPLGALIEIDAIAMK